MCIAIGQNSPNRVQMVSVGAKRVTWISRAWRKKYRNLLNFDAGPPPHHPRHDVEPSHGHDGARPPHHGHDEGSRAGLVGPADSRAGHWVRGAGKDGTTELLRGGGTSLFFSSSSSSSLAIPGTLNH